MIYQTPVYQIENGTPKLYLALGDMTVATVEGSTTTYIHTDHLGGTTLTTDSTGAITQTLDYFPYGETRIDTGTGDEDSQYTGYKKDESTGLNYAGARYYVGNRGQFISQDPVALSLGDWKTVQEKTGGNLGFYLKNPQTHNSYSYAFNNPIKYVDQNGEFAWVPVLIIGGMLLESFLTDVNYAYAPDTSINLTNAPMGTNPLVPGYDSMSPSQKLSMQLAFMAFGSKANVGSLVKQGDNLVPVFRGGSGDNLFSIKPNEVKVDADGFVVNTRGVSVNTDASSLNRFGGANQIEYLPDTLKINQIGNANHYEIVPNGNLTPKQFQSELNKIKTTKVENNNP